MIELVVSCQWFSFRSTERLILKIIQLKLITPKAKFWVEKLTLKKSTFISLLFFTLYISACSNFITNSSQNREINQETTIIPTTKVTATLENIITQMPTVHITEASTPTIPTAAPVTSKEKTSTPIVPSSTSTSKPTQTETTIPTITPIYSILRGQVIPDRVNCRYGPGWPYLYKYGLVGGSNLEIIGRNDLGTWVLIRAIGGTNPCWVKADLMDIRGNLFSVQPLPIEIIQAWSPYYTPLTGVNAERNGDKVIISWHPLLLRAGDDSEQVPYIVEAWTCQDQKFNFTPVGTYVEFVEIIDESGCDELSHGQVIAAEKHGYTKPVEIPWPSPSQ